MLCISLTFWASGLTAYLVIRTYLCTIHVAINPVQSVYGTLRKAADYKCVFYIGLCYSDIDELYIELPKRFRVAGISVNCIVATF